VDEVGKVAVVGFLYEVQSIVFFFRNFECYIVFGGLNDIKRVRPMVQGHRGHQHWISRIRTTLDQTPN